LRSWQCVVQASFTLYVAYSYFKYFFFRPLTDSNLPICDRKSIVILLLEMAFQTASLTSLLQVVSLYLQMNEKGILNYLPLNKFLEKLMKQSFQMDFEPAIVSKVKIHRVIFIDITINLTFFCIGCLFFC